MQLRVLSDTQFRKLDVLSHVLKEEGGREVVEFSHGAGVGMLRWSHQDGATYKVHIAIPLHWLTDAGNADRVEEATRHFVSGVRSAAAR